MLVINQVKVVVSRLYFILVLLTIESVVPMSSHALCSVCAIETQENKPIGFVYDMSKKKKEKFVQLCQ